MFPGFFLFDFFFRLTPPLPQIAILCCWRIFCQIKFLLFEVGLSWKIILNITEFFRNLANHKKDNRIFFSDTFAPSEEEKCWQRKLHGFLSMLLPARVRSMALRLIYSLRNPIRVRAVGRVLAQVSFLWNLFYDFTIVQSFNTC